MKRISYLTIFAVLGISASVETDKTALKKFAFQTFINNHSYSQAPKYAQSEIAEMPKYDRPDLAWEQDFLATMDPALGRPAKERLIPIYQSIYQNQTPPFLAPGGASSPWVERGPNNIAGRTRAIMYDPNDLTQKKVWAGSVGGGLWVNNDITSATSTWTNVNGFWDNIAISCIAYDPNNSNVFYVGTGEGWRNSDAVRGLGIWKSTDGGNTWSHLASTQNFSFVNDLVVRNESGTSVVYAAVDGSYNNGTVHNTNNAGLQRSTNGGSTWTQVLPTITGQTINYVAADIDISNNNTLWVGTKNSPETATDLGGGRILKSTNGTTFTVSHTETLIGGTGRVAIACAPSNANYVYALFEDEYEVSVIKSTTNGGTTWSNLTMPIDADNGIPSNDFSRGQAWYDLVIAVDPNNANTVIVGGIDLFRTTNGGTSWNQISKWSNNNNLLFLNCSLVHADQHAIVFKPGSSSQVLFGNDGGVFYTNSISTAATADVIPSRINNYNVTQFYACAIHPTSGTNQFLAGAQDNGTQRFLAPGMNATSPSFGGDGAFCFIDQTSPTYQYVSYVYNNYYRSTDGGLSFFTNISSNSSTGRFINPADYDDNQDVLYSASSTTEIQRVENASSAYFVSTLTISGMNTMASHIRVSPYTTNSTTLFVGTGTGELYKVTNANGIATTTNITGTNFPSGYISCVEIGANENELLVTFSNYGVNSVWYTANGGTSWTSKEGNLPDMPIRWALFNPTNLNEVILATEVGIWSTTNLNAVSPAWAASNNGMANVRVDMLQLRTSDNEVIAATHGRGLFSSSAFSAPMLPVASFTASPLVTCNADTVVLNNTSTNAMSYNWLVTPNTFSFVNGTTNSSMHPKLYFSGSGAYTIRLIATNAQGTDTLLKTNYVHAKGFPLPFTETWEDTNTYTNWTVQNPDNGITWSIATTAGAGLGSQSISVDNFSYTASDVVSQIDYLLFPVLNFTGYSAVNLTFDHAYKRYDATYQDSLAISVSTNCGVTWTRVAAYRENPVNNWRTGLDFTSPFIPALSSDWCGGSYASCKTVNLTPYAGMANISIRIENLSGYGNNVYIDNISVNGMQQALPPIANFNANKTSPCVSDVVSFTDASTNSPITWAWTFSPSSVTYLNGTNSSSQNPQVKFNTATNYTVTLAATNVGGTDSEIKSNYIQSQATVTPSVNLSSSSDTICAGQNVTFTATIQHGGSSPSYQWKLNNNNVGTNSSSYSNNSLTNTDVVSVVVTSNALCSTSATALSNNKTITVNALPTVSITSNVDLCSNENPISLTGSPAGGTFSGPGVTATTFNPAVSGIGTHTILYQYINANGCLGQASYSQVVLAAPMQPNISLSGLLLSTTAVGVNYQWRLNGSSISGATSSTYTVTANGTYSLKITNPGNGCAIVSADLVVSNISIEELNQAINLEVFPNPTHGLVNITLNNAIGENVRIEISNTLGQLLFSEELGKERTLHHTLNLEMYAAGVYMLKISIGNHIIHKTVSKK